MKELLAQGLARLGLTPPPAAAEQMETYAGLLLEQNKVMNLTAITDSEQVARLHFLDSAALLGCAGDLSGRTLIDVGTGAGFPGMALKLLCPELKLTLLDSLAKRLDWLAAVCSRLGLEDVGLQLNSIGCPECRKEYHKALKEYFTARKEQLCDTCLSRLERNPMRILDCKSPECQEVCKGAPKITDYLCEDCKAHFAKVQEFLTALGIEFEIDPGLVRGLDYYTRTVFEFPSKSLGFALGGGGRYDGLVEEFGGKPTPGLGFGLGLDRIMMALEAQQVEFPQLSKCEMYIATMGEEAQKKAFLLLGELHRCGIPADTDLCGRGLKAQMKYADKIGAKFTMVLGDNELQQGKAEMKNMKTGEKRKISISGEDFINDYVTVSTEAEDFSQDGIFF